MSVKAFVQSLTAIISSISALLLAVEFLQGLSQNSYDLNSILTFSLTFLISWYVLGAITEALNDSLKKILAFFGLPTFIISLLIAAISLLI